MIGKGAPHNGPCRSWKGQARVAISRSRLSRSFRSSGFIDIKNEQMQPAQVRVKLPLY